MHSIKTILFPLLFILALNGRAQWVGFEYESIEPAKLVVTYNLTFQPDSTDTTSKRKTKMLLLRSENVSLFINRANYINDTTTRKFTADQQVIDYLTRRDAPRASILYYIYKNYPPGRLTYIEHIPSETYKYSETLDPFHWVLIGDTGIILGYKVYKATCEYGGRNWTAWFAPDIPVNDGPYKFSGLPGLILKVADSRNHYDFEIQSIERPAKPLMIDIKNIEYLVTTKERFFKAQDSFREDIISRAKEAGMGSASQQVAYKNMLSRNNPIELDRK